jgi:hypothetical protein
MNAKGAKISQKECMKSKFFGVSLGGGKYHFLGGGGVGDKVFGQCLDRLLVRSDNGIS